jgi:3-methyladenine DNA glycosylase AlkD
MKMCITYPPIFEKFYAAADSNQAVKMSKYIRDLFPFLGIPTPRRKEISKDFLNSVKKQHAIDWIFVNRLLA